MEEPTDQGEEEKEAGEPMNQEEVELVARKREAAEVTQTALQKPHIAPSLAIAGLRQATQTVALVPPPIPTLASAAVTPIVPSGLHTAPSLDTAGRQQNTVQRDRANLYVKCFLEAFFYNFFIVSKKNPTVVYLNDSGKL